MLKTGNSCSPSLYALVLHMMHVWMCKHASMYACMCVNWCSEAVVYPCSKNVTLHDDKFGGQPLVFPEQEPYWHCFGPPNWHLAITGEANSKLCMSHLMVEAHVGTSWSYMNIHETCVAPCGHKYHHLEEMSCINSRVPVCCTGIPACLGRCDCINCFLTCVCVYVVVSLTLIINTS